MKKQLLTLFVLLTGIETPLYADDGAKCFESIIRGSVPYEVYSGVRNNRKTYLQPMGNEITLSNNAVEIIPYVTYEKKTVLQLCDGRIVVVWNDDAYSNRPKYLYNRIYDKHINALGEMIRVTEEDESQWDHSAAALLNSLYVVIWKTDKLATESVRRSGTQIRARIFGPDGGAITDSFTVTSNPGKYSGLKVSGMPDGGFVVAWLSSNGTTMRIFDNDGTSRTGQILVANVAREPYVYVTHNEKINIFLRNDSNLNEMSPFTAARSFDTKGDPLTPLFKIERISGLEGYQESLEKLMHNYVRFLEFHLRSYIQKDPVHHGICKASYMSKAAKVSMLSKKERLKQFATKFCKEYQSCCGTPVYKKQKRQLEACVSG